MCMFNKCFGFFNHLQKFFFTHYKLSPSVTVFKKVFLMEINIFPKKYLQSASLL